MKTVFRRHRPTNHYDPSVLPIDEQLCSLVAKRKAVSNNNPGFPSDEQIDRWAEQYGLHENHVHSLFLTLYNEDLHLPRLEPEGFRGIVPVMKLSEMEGQAFLITHLRQYDNATVLYFQVDYQFETKPTQGHPPHVQWELFISPEYKCYSSGGSGNNEQSTRKFVVSPRLPDDLGDLTFKFSWRYMRPDDQSEESGEVFLR